MKTLTNKKKRKKTVRSIEETIPDVATRMDWLRYRGRGRSVVIRNRLAERYMYAVVQKAQVMKEGIPDTVDIQDMVQVGSKGLMRAIRKYNPHRGVKFETYCQKFIMGAILDEFRTQDWVPRLVRQRTKIYAEKVSSMTADLGRVPSDDEVRRALKVTREEFERIKSDGNTRELGSLSMQVNGADVPVEDMTRPVTLVKEDDGPLNRIMSQDLKEFICQDLSKLERRIMLMYYWGSMTMREIAACINMSESRVSQIHAEIIEKMRTRFADDMESLTELLTPEK